MNACVNVCVCVCVCVCLNFFQPIKAEECLYLSKHLNSLKEEEFGLFVISLQKTLPIFFSQRVIQRAKQKWLHRNMWQKRNLNFLLGMNKLGSL
jgi:hypothetical protein